MAYYAMQKGKASVMITGSHIPNDRNGIKFYKHDGEVLKVDESGIIAEVARSGKRSMPKARTRPCSTARGCSKSPGRWVLPVKTPGRREALAIAKQFKFPVRVAKTAEFENPDYTANPANRC